MRVGLAAGLGLLLTGVQAHTAHAQTIPAPAAQVLSTPADELRITGQVRHPATLRLDDLRAMPSATVQWSFGTEKGDRTALFEGPLLWDLVKAADPIDAPGAAGAAGRTHLEHVIVAHGSDGYAAAIAIGEIDPAFEGKKVIVALPRPGQPTLQLAVPNDARGGRGVHDLAELEVR